MLTTMMRIQSVVFAVYGLTFFFIPDFTLGTIFGWETTSIFPRIVGAGFVGLGWLEWNVVNRITERRDLVWPYVGVPVLILVALIWEQAAGTYEGSDLFFWVSVVLTVFFSVSVSVAAIRSE